MKPTGVIRRIDELGRIVIPKEIRKNLGIREGENLEILLENNKIILEKHSPLVNYESLIDNLTSIISEISDETVIITDREKVVSSNKKELVTSSIKDFIYYIDNRESKTSDELERYVIGNDAISGYFSIYPIISSSDCFGLVIIIDKTSAKSENEALSKLIAKIIANKLDIC